MILKDFNIQEFNNSMEEDVSKQTLNFCKAVILSTKKLSITVKHDPAARFQEGSPKYVTLNTDLTTRDCSDFDKFYYGASPAIDSTLILDAISNLSFRTTSGLEQFISQNCSHFMLHDTQAKYLLDVAKLIVLTVAAKYGITFKLCDQLAFLPSLQNSFPQMITVNEKAGTISLHGCPTDELIHQMKQYRFENKDGIWVPERAGKTFTDIYSEKKNISLLVGKVFYSGVLLKPVKIYSPNNNHENDIPNYQILYERSTFSAVCAFDEKAIRHPLLSSSTANLEKMFLEDDACKDTLARQLSDDCETNILKSVNEYIQKSINVNQIGVSGTVKTADGQIFFGLRDSGNIDTGCLYPGINGNAEVYDPGVSFYHCSIYEDLPTVRLDDPRSDLLGEIEREAYGELRLISKREMWESYGMIISGNLPNSSTDQSRRCHFNILFENEVDLPLKTIIERKQKASESFENKSFAGIRIRTHRNKLHRFLNGGISLCKGLLSSKDFIESILVLLLAFTATRAVPVSLGNISSIFSFIFAFLILLTDITHLINSLVKQVRRSRITKTIHIYQNTKYPQLCKTISRSLKNKYHPAAYASLKMHIENLIYSCNK